MSDGAARGGVAPSPPALEIENLSKTFGGVRALDRASLTVQHGEIHGLLGQNGSGKSTLIKILAGFHEPDPGGRLRIAGQPVQLPLPTGAFRHHGISFVHQHLGLIPSLTVVENLLIGELASRSLWQISWPKAVAYARTLFARHRLDIDPRVEAAKLSPVQQALLAIVRAFEELRKGGHLERHGTGLIVLDEPTPFLPAADVSELFRLLRELVAAGASAIFVSHDVDEVMEITDRATVLRDGRVAGTITTKSASKDELVEMIVGRRLERARPPHPDLASRPVKAAIRGLSAGIARNVSIDVHEGEVLGLTGLIGSGYDEILYAICGAKPARSGTLTLHGDAHELAHMTAHKAIEAGCVVIPGDRSSGAIAVLNVIDNLNLPVLDKVFNPWRLSGTRMARHANYLTERFDVRPRDPHLLFGALSGGNQQKVLLAKWLQQEPNLILLDEPTQGVDVGAREQVFEQIREAAARGAAVLCASSDQEQLEAIASRVLVFSRGRQIGELIGAQVSKDAITCLCYRGGDEVVGKDREAAA
jgi:ribose transport system ATP-binding protein